MNKKEFSKILIEARAGKGWNLKQAARRIGCSEQSLQKWEEGLRIPSICSLALIRETYGLPLEIMVVGINK